MAFPTVAATGTGHTEITNGTSKEINCPAALTGDRLVLLMAWDAGPTVSITDVNSQSWVERIDASGGGAIRFYVYEIVSLTADINSQTVTVTLGGSQSGAAQIIAVRGSHAAEALAASTAATGNSDTPDPSSLSPSWGSEDTLWIAVCGQDDGRRTVSAYPTNYTNGTDVTTGQSGGALLGYARRELAASSDDPGAFTTSATDEWVAVTLAIRPAADAGLSITPAAVTVNATPGTLSVAPGAVDITPATVTVQATPGTLSVALNAALDAPTVTATPGAVTLAPGAVDITPDPVTVTVTPGTLSVSAGAGTQDITPGAVTVTATPGSLSLAIDIVPDPVTVTATPGSLTVTSGATGITPEPVTVTASPGSLTVTTGVVDITPAPVTVTATPGTLTATAGGLVLDAPTVTATPGTLTLTTGAVDITPDPVTVTATPGTLDVGLAVGLDAPTVTVTPGTLSVAAGATSIVPEPVTVTVAPGVMVLTGGQTADLNPIKLSFREPSRHLTRTETAHVTRRESAHVTYQEG